MSIVQDKQNKRTLVLGVAGVVVVVVIALVAITVRRSAVVPGGEGKGRAPAAGEQLPGGVQTRGAVPQNVVVPELNASGTPENVAVPTTAAASSRDAGSSSKYRKYDVKVEGGEFVPETIIVNQGDTVRVDLLAVDKDYDFTQPELGYNFPLLKGKTQPLAFTATSAGDFLFYCKSCGGPEKGPRGHLIVAVPKKP